MGDKGDVVDDLAWYEQLDLGLCFVSLDLGLCCFASLGHFFFVSLGLGLCCCCFLSSFLLKAMVMVDEGMRAMMLGIGMV